MHVYRVNLFLVGLALFASTASTRAGDFVFDVPQLIGNYLGDDSLALPPVDVSLDLGMTFAEINSATLQYTGVQTVGAFGDLNVDGQWPLSADLLGQFRDSQSRWSLAEVILPAVSGGFDVSADFRAVGWPSEPPDFSNWLDGTADFTFVAATPPMIATTYIINMPAVEIQSAQLVINGQPDLDSFMVLGDFNGDGLIDGKDVGVWQRALGSSDDADANANGMTDGRDLLIWQRGVGEDASGAATPEPGTLALLGLVLLAGSGIRRR